jgi:hypothetical protein
MIATKLALRFLAATSVFNSTILLAQPAAAPATTEADAQSQKGPEKFTLEISPVALDSEDIGKVSLGVEYKFKGDVFFKDLSGDDSGNDSLNPDATIGGVGLRLTGRGTVATSSDRNPKNLLETDLSLNGLVSTSHLGTFLFGGLVKYETDQKFDNSQVILGAQASWGKYSLFGRNDFLAFDLNYGRVNPGEDKERLAALSVTSLPSYDRLSFEALYMLNTGWDLIPTLELNYRLFQEMSPPTAIKLAKLDKFETGSVRLGLLNNFFVAYTVGKLPFDRSSDKILELGFSYKLN